MIWLIVIISIIACAAIGWLIYKIVESKEDRRKYGELEKRLQEKNNEDARQKLQDVKNAEDRLSGLESRIKDGEEKAETLDERIWSRSKELDEVSKRLVEAQSQVAAATQLKQEIESKVDELKKTCAAIDAELNDAKNTNRAVMLKEEDGEGWTFELSGKEKKLISTLQEIEGMYPELEKELAGIEWKKIWLPKVQALCVRERLACRGIYRLVLREDKNVCYVGQAVNVKERWYEHIKKMIGADGRGNEKLYEYRPEDFEWSVVERDVEDLNKAERYWIEYYCCVEKGLNRK